MNFQKQPFVNVFQNRCVIKNFTNFTGKHLCWSPFLTCNFIKKRLQYNCFPVKFRKFLRTLVFTEHCICLDTRRKLNVHHMFSRRPGPFLSVFVRPVYVLCPGWLFLLLTLNRYLSIGMWNANQPTKVYSNSTRWP